MNQPDKDPQRLSLVFSFEDQLHLEAPEPDYAAWLEFALMADSGTAYDSFIFPDLPAAEREAWKLFHDAIQATRELLDLYTTRPAVFRRIARQMSVLPSFLSWHPEAEEFNRNLFRVSGLGADSMFGELRQNPRHLVRQSWPVRYAYALIATIDLTLDTYSDRLAEWAASYEPGVAHPLSPQELERAIDRLTGDEPKRCLLRQRYEGACRILPKWTQTLPQLPRPFSSATVDAYWRKAKEILLEELPEFPDRPEWASYHRRRYADGALKGRVRGAIFADIRKALGTIAGSDRRAGG